mmetsp:Transcript_6479/g.9099  ORF Transcript_6479/g.9099 Transcript_6479/m.9099 type:complete len:521 (+) Transcript_6479:49-1611(+)
MSLVVSDGSTNIVPKSKSFQIPVRDWANGLGLVEEKVNELNEVADRLVDLEEADDRMLCSITKHWGKCVRFRFLRALNRDHICDDTSIAVIDADIDQELESSQLKKKKKSQRQESSIEKKEKRVTPIEKRSKLKKIPSPTPSIFSSSSAEIEEDVPQQIEEHMESDEKKRNDDTTDFRLGDEIEARYLGNRTRYYRGIIVQVCADGTYCIDYDDGDKESNVQKKYIRYPKNKNNKASDKASYFWEGDIVEAMFKKRMPFFPARIIRRRSDGTFDLEFGDASIKEFRVQSKYIRKLNSDGENNHDDNLEDSDDEIIGAPLKEILPTTTTKKRRKSPSLAPRKKKKPPSKDCTDIIVSTQNNKEEEQPAPDSNFVEVEATPAQTWIQCEACEKWRPVSSNYIAHDKWTCKDHPDPAWACCDIPMPDFSDTVEVVSCSKCGSEFAALGDHRGLCTTCEPPSKKSRYRCWNTQNKKFSSLWVHNHLNRSAHVRFTSDTNPRQTTSTHGRKAAKKYDIYSKKKNC